MDSREKLKNRPVEPDTKLLKVFMLEFDGFPGVFEHWSWDGIRAYSVILVKEDVAGFTKEALVELVFKQFQMPVDPQLTYSDKGEFVFVNFGFEAE